MLDTPGTISLQAFWKQIRISNELSSDHSCDTLPVGTCPFVVSPAIRLCKHLLISSARSPVVSDSPFSHSTNSYPARLIPTEELNSSVVSSSIIFSATTQPSMPLYDVEHTLPLSPAVQQFLAQRLTDLHTKRFKTPGCFINVRYTDVS